MFLACNLASIFGPRPLPADVPTLTVQPATRATRLAVKGLPLPALSLTHPLQHPLLPLAQQPLILLQVLCLLQQPLLRHAPAHLLLPLPPVPPVP